MTVEDTRQSKQMSEMDVEHLKQLANWGSSYMKRTVGQKLSEMERALHRFT
jgi:hypothetical protein